MTNENAATTDTTAAVAEQGANVAPEKVSSKKGASKTKGTPKGQKGAKGGKPKAAEPKKTAPAKKAAKAPKKTAKPKESAGPREGSKTAQVVAMLQRKNGATLAEIHGADAVAEAYRPWLHGRRDEEGRIQRSVLQA
jgi:hypothetical protein